MENPESPHRIAGSLTRAARALLATCVPTAASITGPFYRRGAAWHTDEQGRYRFESVVPGRYPFPWPFTRPRHIHVIVTHPSHERLVTQIFFEGERSNRWDPW